MAQDGASTTTHIGIENNENKHGYAYSPHKIYKLYGNIKISKKLTEWFIPYHIKENIPNIYDYLYKCIALILIERSDCDIGNLKIFNCGFHDKSGHVLYLIAHKSNLNNYQYIMRDRLYTKKQILESEELSMVSEYNLPTSTKISTVDMDKIINMSSESFLKTKWHKLRVFNMINNKQRLTFSITTTEFAKTIETFIYNNKTVLPIIMFTDNNYRVEYIQIIPLQKNGHVYSIGISYIYDTYYDVKVTGIHLNKNNILKQHQLICMEHNCQCLDSFHSELDYLHIGNPDDDKNRSKDYKKKNDILKMEKRQIVHEKDAIKSENERLTTENKTMQIKICQLEKKLEQMQLQKKTLIVSPIICNLMQIPLPATPQTMSSLSTISQSLSSTPQSFPSTFMNTPVTPQYTNMISIYPQTMGNNHNM